jgi:hypothetical protein
VAEGAKDSVGGWSQALFSIAPSGLTLQNKCFRTVSD